jgi:hypothetical protein
VQRPGVRLLRRRLARRWTRPQTARTAQKAQKAQRLKAATPRWLQGLPPP